MTKCAISTETTRRPWTYWLWPVRWRPLLDAWIDVGLFQIQTGVWREAWHNDCVDYLILEFRLLRKWGFRLRLYDTAMRKTER
jgi:hypothetical protein